MRYAKSTKSLSNNIQIISKGISGRNTHSLQMGILLAVWENVSEEMVQKYIENQG